MMGVSKYMTRAELLKQKSTGITPDIDPMTQKRFDAGHTAEASARAIIEGIINEELYPIVATSDDGRLLASSDGATMLFDIGFEHKLLNAELAEQVRNGIVPDSHAWQLDHQIAVLGFEKIIFVCSDGTAENMVMCEYRTTPERQVRLMAGWEQFERDLAEYVPTIASEDKPTGHAPEALPALRIEVTGMVTASNLDAFKTHALAVFAGIKTDLQTDADFADAEKTVKWAKDVEDRLEAAKDHALSQTTSIDQLFRTIDAIKDEARAVRLKLDKLVKTEKEARKLQIITEAQQAFARHMRALNERVGGFMPHTAPAFGEAVRGLKSLDSMRDKASSALANAKIDANAIADRIDANRKMVDDMSLMPDFNQVCTKAPDDFAALLAMRKQQRADAEAKRLEAERAKIRAEEQAKAQREAEQKAQMAEHERLVAEREAKRQAAQKEAQEAAHRAEQAAQQARATQQAEAAAKPADPEPVQFRPAAPVVNVDPGKTLTLGQINALLSPIQLSKDGIASLGIQPRGRDKSAVLYFESDAALIASALIRRLEQVAASSKSPQLTRGPRNGISQ